MEGKGSFIFPLVITAILVSPMATLSSIPLRPDFVPRWLSAFLLGWRVAAVPALLATPVAHSLTRRIVGLIDRAA